MLDDLISALLGWLRDLSSSGTGSLAFLQSIDPVLRAVLAGLATALETFVVTGLIVPGDTIVLIAAAAVASPLEGVGLGGAIAIGALLGESAGYALGAWIGTSSRGARLRRRAGEQRISSARAFLLAHGGSAILASRFVPVLRTVMPFVVGLSGYPFRRFLAWAAPGAIAWSAIYVTVYSLAAAPLRDGSGSLLLTLSFAGFGILLFLAAFVAEQVLRRRTPTAPAASAGGVEPEV